MVKFVNDYKGIYFPYELINDLVQKDSNASNVKPLPCHNQN